MVACWAAEGEAARERRRPAGVGPPVGGSRRRGREEAGGVVVTSLVRVGGGGGRRRRRRGRRRSLGRWRMAGERREKSSAMVSIPLAYAGNRLPPPCRLSFGGLRMGAGGFDDM